MAERIIVRRQGNALVPVEKLSESERGQGGFGSTGVA